MLELRQVSKSYHDRKVLRPTSLTIEPGKTYVLIGPSGCGKSTLLRLMVGLIRPDSGMVLFQGQDLATSDLLAIRRHLGYVIQEGGLFPHLTARQNIALMARYLGWGETKIRERVSSLSAMTHFPQEALDRFPGQLSGGQRQRVSLMRALMLDPEVLLLDEPLGALDPMIRAELQSDLRQIFSELGKTVVLVTHDMGEAGYFGHSIVLLKEGQIVQQGTLNELLDSPAAPFVAQFINAQRLTWEERR